MKNEFTIDQTQKIICISKLNHCIGKIMGIGPSTQGGKLESLLSQVYNDLVEIDKYLKHEFFDTTEEQKKEWIRRQKKKLKKE